MGGHPVRLIVTDDLRRSRLTALFRLFLALPHLLWLGVWGYGVQSPLLVYVWLAVLFSGRQEEDVHRFLGRLVRYQTQVYAYLLLVADPFPRFHGRPGSYPIDLELDPPERQHRLVAFFRLVLVIPAFVFATVLGVVLVAVGVVAWLSSLALGRVPKGLRDLGAYCLRFQAQTWAYLYLLTDRYPSLSSGPG